MAWVMLISKVSFAVFAAVLALAQPAAAEIDASAAAFTAPAGTTRFVLELSGEPQPRIFVVDKPPRLVVDIDDVQFGIEGPIAPAGLVSDWRYGPLGPNTGRIVFDLAEPALVMRQFYLPSLAGRPGRLVLDLQRVSAPRFAAAARSARASVDAVPAIQTEDARAVVVLDPGHGGIDPGASSGDGTLEKDLALAFAKRVAAELEAVPGLKVQLTRTDDSFLSLNRRIRVARAYGADLFVSIHADAAPQNFVHGASVYTSPSVRRMPRPPRLRRVRTSPMPSPGSSSRTSRKMSATSSPT